MATLRVHCFSMSPKDSSTASPAGTSEPLVAGDGVAHAVIRRS
jgi:hypothetical protein